MKVVLAYSGGLDTSVMIPWLKEKYGCEVVAYVGDVGQGDNMAEVKRKAIRTGASKAIVRDLRNDFVKNYCWPVVRAGAVYEGNYLLGTAIARPCIAKAMVEVALAEKADAIAHGATGKGNDQVRFEMAAMTMAPHLKIIAPWREWDIKSRTEEIDYAQSMGIPVPVTKKFPYSMDRNLWHLSMEGGELEDLGQVLPEKAYQWTKNPETAPAGGATVRVGFREGFPVSVNGKKLAPVPLIETLNRLGAAHGVGRADCVENRLVGMKSRGVYETPGGTILQASIAELAAVSLDRETFRMRQSLSIKYAELVYYGQWFTPLMESLDAFMANAAKRLTGEITLRLKRGRVTVLKRSSPFALYRASLATFEEGEAYDQRHSEGFIRLFGLPYPRRQA
jgi:argininosuccinate synthase